ncbi:MAG: hypothetical protein KGI80_00085 [Verrucomicrobiota bacterium]|nr:hypothetical protein [Verrucomicrobiota bacterium]
MLELTAVKKQRIQLSDYDYQKDIAHRILLAEASDFDLEVIEEILFSPLRVSYKKIARHMECTEEKLLLLLQKLKEVGLVTFEGDQILIDKESRKHFEFFISRFDPAFRPDFDAIQALLRRVPIHLLPSWYALPRTSNNIFTSILEKYLLTPQIFQRYLAELHFNDPVISRIVKDLFAAPDYTLSARDVMTRYKLSRPHFAEVALLLEFHFIAYLSYRKEEGRWVEFLTPFYEWHNYLRFLKETEPMPLDKKKVMRSHASDFAFVEEMGRLLEALLRQPLPLKGEKAPLTERALQKLLLLQLATEEKGLLYPMEGARQWVEKDLENRALYLYRHPLNLAAMGSNERQIREGEKTIRRAGRGEWMGFDDFCKGVSVALGEGPSVMLRKEGKHYQYARAVQGEEEKNWLKRILFDWLFETGMVAVGTFKGGGSTQDAFLVTPFGRFCFEE